MNVPHAASQDLKRLGRMVGCLLNLRDSIRCIFGRHADLFELGLQIIVCSEIPKNSIHLGRE